jgi:hypothetical protein
LSGNTISFTGTPAASGTFNGSITIVDSAGARVSKTFSVIINPSLVLHAVSLPNWTIGRAYSQRLSAVGGTGPVTFWVSAGALPPGLTLKATGTLSGTPTATGTFNFTISATQNTWIYGSRSYTVAINPLIAFSLTSLPVAILNEDYSQDLSGVTGGTGFVTIRYVLSKALPIGLTLDSVTGVLNGKATNAATVTITATASDTVGAVTIKTFTLTVS